MPRCTRVDPVGCQKSAEAGRIAAQGLGPADSASRAPGVSKRRRSPSIRNTDVLEKSVSTTSTAAAATKRSHRSSSPLTLWPRPWRGPTLLRRESSSSGVRSFVIGDPPMNLALESKRHNEPGQLDFACQPAEPRVDRSAAAVRRVGERRLGRRWSRHSSHRAGNRRVGSGADGLVTGTYAAFNCTVP